MDPSHKLILRHTMTVFTATFNTQKVNVRIFQEQLQRLINNPILKWILLRCDDFMNKIQ